MQAFAAVDFTGVQPPEIEDPFSLIGATESADSSTPGPTPGKEFRHSVEIVLAQSPNYVLLGLRSH